MLLVRLLEKPGLNGSTFESGDFPYTRSNRVKIHHSVSRSKGDEKKQPTEPTEEPHETILKSTRERIETKMASSAPH